jgi:O-antigen/teichoic acid export membrane protein
MGELKQAYVDGWSLFVASASSGLQASTNVFVLGLVSSRAQVGFYDAADRVKGTAIAPLSAIASAYFPFYRLMAADRPKAKRLLLYLAAVITLAMTICSMILYFLAPSNVRLLMRDQYDDAIIVLQLLSPVPVIYGMNSLLGSMAMVNLGLDKQFTFITVSSVVLSVCMIVGLGSVYGAIGAAVAMIITETLVMLAFAWVLYRRADWT